MSAAQQHGGGGGHSSGGRNRPDAAPRTGFGRGGLRPGRGRHHRLHPLGQHRHRAADRGARRPGRHSLAAPPPATPGRLGPGGDAAPLAGLGHPLRRAGAVGAGRVRRPGQPGRPPDAELHDRCGRPVLRAQGGRVLPLALLGVAIVRKGGRRRHRPDAAAPARRGRRDARRSRYAVWALLGLATLVLWARSRAAERSPARPALVLERLATGPILRVLLVSAGCGPAGISSPAEGCAVPDLRACALAPRTQPPAPQWQPDVTGAETTGAQALRMGDNRGDTETAGADQEQSRCERRGRGAWCGPI